MFTDIISDYYPWIKSLHIISVISWMAGLFYLPRLFVYHAEKAAPGGELSETLKVMERRLLRAIMNPSMIATWVFGILLLLTPGIVDWDSLWIWIKLVLVGLMTAFHHALGLWRKDFDADRNERSGRFYRIWNEAPTLLMFGIVILVVVRPF
ncbi:MAG: protoporphyrinogen oxidase HemJ [Pseudomonadota bacterium]